MTKYYILVDDKRIPERWYLNGPRRMNGPAVDPRDFTTGNPVQVGSLGSLTIPIRRAGRPLEFTLGDFDLPVVSSELGATLKARCAGEIQLIPAQVEGATMNYEILNLTQRVRCLDEKQSGVTWWTPADGRPDKVGEYMIVAHPRVDPTRVAGQQIFRIQGWENVIVVSDEISDVFSSRVGPVLQPA
jgi:hypothetical protein